VLGALLPGAQHVQSIHPLVVHFPIALLFGAAALYVLAWLAPKRESWGWTGLWMLGLGTAGAAAAVASGLYAANGVMVAPSVRDHLLLNHEHIMLGVLGLSVILFIWAWLARPVPLRGGLVFLLLLGILLAALTVGADYGGRMVFDYNAGGNACSQPIEFSQ
jgi:uncharacterized membrane protein